MLYSQKNEKKFCDSLINKNNTAFFSDKARRIILNATKNYVYSILWIIERNQKEDPKGWIWMNHLFNLLEIIIHMINKKKLI